MTKTTYIELTCGHSRYYAGARPQKGDLVWCVDCDDESIVGKPMSSTGGVLEIEWNWTYHRTKRGGHRGVCRECGHTTYDSTYSHLANKMETHHLGSHTPSGKVGILITVEDFGYEPPF